MFQFAEFQLRVHVFLFARVNSEHVLSSQFHYNFVPSFTVETVHYFMCFTIVSPS